MAVQGPLIEVGYCISAFDGRNSTITGTTLSGPNGSGQFLAVQLSTTVAFTVQIASTAASGGKIFGILQNKPSTGIAADVGIFGVSKAVAGLATIVMGMELEASSTALGTLIPFSSAAGVYSVGRALESAATVGAVFTAYIYGNGGSLA